MRIKKLEIVGFKSFKDRTVIHFDAGITGIVGPNGCGKSNIVDALVWVMGEMSAKHLRGSSMEDVIFAGAEGYAPMGLCEVSLTLENDGGPFPVQYLKHSEIMVTRRLHRSGESEYYVNKEPSRLRDIQEIFMDTGAGAKGFSIIQQNAIGQMITAKPEDRRMLIEEAAGITKFKARKRESQRKLISTEQNLVRLHDIVNELKRQIDSLQRQAQRAERYRNLKREIEDLDLWLSSKQFLDLKEISETAAAEHTEAEAAELQAQSSLGGQEAELETLRVQSAELENQVTSAQTNHRTLRDLTSKAETEIQELRFEIETARRNKEMTGSLVQENQTRKEILESDLERVRESLASIREEAIALKTEFDTKRDSFENSSSRIQEIDDTLTDSRRELLTVSQGESAISARITSLGEAIAGIEERESEAQAILTELLEKRHEFEGRRKKVWNDLERERQEQLDLSRDVESFAANKASLTSQIEERRNEVDRFKENLNEVTGRLYGLENLASNFEGFEAGVKSVMFWQRQKLETMPESQRAEAANFHPVAEVVEVPAEYELAMEAALGPRLQMLLSDDPNSAMSAVSYLKEQKSGRSSFVAGGLQVVEQTLPDINPDMIKAVLMDVVRVPERFSGVVGRLLQNVAVVDSMERAFELRQGFPHWTFVTTEGDLVSSDGVITGGTAESADSGMLKRRREIKELSLQKDEWSGKLSLGQVSLKKLEESLRTLISDLEAAQRRNQEKEIVLAGLKKDLDQAERELTNASQAISRQEKDVHSLTSQKESRSNELAELEERRTELSERKLGLETSIDALQTELLTARNGIDDLQEEVTRLEVRSAQKTSECEGLERQEQMLARSFDDVMGQLSRMNEESERSTESMSSNQVVLEQRKVELEDMIRRTEEAEQDVSRFRNEYEEIHSRVRELEKTLSNHMTERNQLQAKMNDARLRLEQAKMKEQYLVDQVRERYILDLGEIAERYRGREGDVEASELQLKELKEKISRIGDVNLSAIEEYDEVQKRYDFLSTQQNELNEAKEQLKKVIDRINRICAKRFRETFEQVNERFTKVFPVLFGGGEAQLILSEDPEKGEMGIDIIAKPPGKKLQNVSLLSGGEKALTAVSLIFSIFLVKPSPYCLLDEVDAPLDDANVFRYNDLVKEMAKRSQIIVVTHNKYTMEVSQKLYGVTMEEKGVSKMVSVNLGDAAAQGLVAG
ncbi:MAG: chromosome segregation protein SMC [Bdellovibrionota bacterium]